VQQRLARYRRVRRARDVECEFAGVILREGPGIVGIVGIVGG
jgi:hypothetical protein